jgi:AraC-like DNA-binding protein
MVPLAHVSIFFVRALADVLRARGVSPDVLGGQQEGGARLALSDLEGLLTRAVRGAEEPALGLSCGWEAAESSFGLISPLIAHAPSLRVALQLLGRFQPLLIEGGGLEVIERDAVATLRCQLPRHGSLPDERLAELVVAGLVRLLRAFGCTQDSIHAVCLEHARPLHHAAYARLFGGKERFGQPYLGVALCAELLDRPNLHADVELVTVLRAEAERALDRLLRPLGWAERVLRVMRRQPQLEALDAANVASQLGMSDRSLRRHLRDEGASYRALACTVLQEVACMRLRDGGLSIQHIADELGFADTTAFHRAFKRWTGLTPTHYRALASVPVVEPERALTA